MIKPAIFLVICSLFLSGCDVTVGSIRSCAVWEYQQINGKPKKSELLASQIPALNRWFAALDPDWTFEIVDQPLYGLLLRVKTEKGRTQFVDLRGNTMRVGYSYTVLTGSERAALDQILAPEYRLPDFRESE